jgi:hypothetical protein
VEYIPQGKAVLKDILKISIMVMACTVYRIYGMEKDGLLPATITKPTSCL